MTSAHPLRGALLFITGLLLFACLDTTTKYLAAKHSVPFIVAARYLGNLMLMVVLLAPTYGRNLVQTERTGLVLVRAFSLAAASLLVGFALQRMPVAETTAIIMVAPIIVTAAAGRLLGEQVGRVGWGAVLLGFSGVLLIVRPGGGLEAVGVLCALGTVVANTSYQLLSRVLAATEGTIAMLFYSALGGSIIFGLGMPWFWEGRVPTGLETVLFASLGLYAAIGHYLFTAAYRQATASLLAPMNYLQLLWAGLLGWVVFGHVPDHVSVLGMAAIAASGVMMAAKRRRAPSNGLA